MGFWRYVLGAGVLGAGIFAATQMDGCNGTPAAAEIPYNKPLRITQVVPYPMHDASQLGFVGDDSFIMLEAEGTSPSGGDPPKRYRFKVRLSERSEGKLKRTAGTYDGKHAMLTSQERAHPLGPASAFPVRVETIDGVDYISVHEDRLRVYDDEDQNAFPRNVPLHPGLPAGPQSRSGRTRTDPRRRALGEALDSYQHDLFDSRRDFLAGVDEVLKTYEDNELERAVEGAQRRMDASRQRVAEHFQRGLEVQEQRLNRATRDKHNPS